MAICPRCFSGEMVRHGKYRGKQRWRCLNCGKTTSSPRQRRPKRKK